MPNLRTLDELPMHVLIADILRETPSMLDLYRKGLTRFIQGLQGLDGVAMLGCFVIETSR